MRIRPATPEDYAAVVSLNREAAPAMGDVDTGFFQVLGPFAAPFLVAEEASLVAFLIAFPPGVPYESENYRWFSGRFEDFLYIDRIAVTAAWRGRGVGGLLYDAVMGRSPTTILCCEVNLRPPNPESLAFHQRLGFRVVGEQDTEGGRKRVALLVRGADGEPP
jgi:uncharacterized protein